MPKLYWTPYWRANRRPAWRIGTPIAMPAKKGFPMCYKNPAPTVDVIIEKNDRIVLVKRRNPPFGWALPGGFVNEGERVEKAAVREAGEETGLDVEIDDFLYLYSDPARDPRKHTVTAVFIAHADGLPCGGDDAEQARYFPLSALPEPIVFDHATIIGDYVIFKKTGERREFARALTQLKSNA